LEQLEFSWKDCGDASYASKINKISLMPDPLNLPGNVTLGFSGDLDMDLQAPLKVYFCLFAFIMCFYFATSRDVKYCNQCVSMFVCLNV